jgi:uncharacterized protein YbjT (DUF2867 family)
MYAITGITGKVGGTLAAALLAEGQPVRAVVRDRAKGEVWAVKGCEVAVAEMEDAAGLANAFAGAEAVFILPPSEFDPTPGFLEAHRVIDAVTTALLQARPARVVCLSTIGADAPLENLLTQRTLLEQALSEIDIPVTFLRPGWFMENATWDVAAARNDGVLHSFLQPVDRAISMVSTRDVGRAAADLMQQKWSGIRIIELEGPRRVSPNDIASAFAAALGRPVRVEIVARPRWEGIFRAQGTRNPEPRIRMLDGFNEGWIAFRDDSSNLMKGATPIAEVIAALVADAADDKAT